MATFSITSASAAPAHIGAPCDVSVQWDVSGTPSAAYPVHFELAGQTTDVWINDLTPGTKTTDHAFALPLDGKLPWTVTVDPQSVAGSGQPTATGTVTPLTPASSIEYYDATYALGSQTVWIRFLSRRQPATLSEIVVMAGVPRSETWQTVLGDICVVDAGGTPIHLSSKPSDNAGKQPVYLWDAKQQPAHNITMTQQFALELFDVRVDADALRTVKWADLDALGLKAGWKHWQSPESVVQSADPAISDFVKQTLGANHRNSYTPYDAARTLFQAVLKHVTYYYPDPGAPDLRPPTAVEMLKGIGDCGGFSILLVACYRNIGFPARTACGWWFGTNAGHCWCELWFPGHGWVVSDGSAGNSWSKDGSYAYCFGNVSDLHARFAIMRGNTFGIGPTQATWLQNPTWPQVTGKPQPKSIDMVTTLAQATQADAQAAAAAWAPQVVRIDPKRLGTIVSNVGGHLNGKPFVENATTVVVHVPGIGPVSTVPIHAAP
jgi:Transglutaminase-like superfamily